MPLIVRWPGAVEAGSTCPAPVTSTDFYPTMLAMAGLPPRPEQHRDGLSLVPLLRQAGGVKREAIFWHYPHYNDRLAGGDPKRAIRPCSAVRAGNYKLIEFLEDGRCELYDLADDIGEKNDLSRKLPDRAAELKRMLADWRKSVGAQMPVPNVGRRTDGRAGK